MNQRYLLHINLMMMMKIIKVMGLKNTMIWIIILIEKKLKRWENLRGKYIFKKLIKIRGLINLMMEKIYFKLQKMI
jgi:hypothetical protein